MFAIDYGNLNTYSSNTDAQLASAIKADIFQMHWTVSEEEYLRKLHHFMIKYEQQAPEFSNYFRRQWGEGVYCRWQMWNNPRGFATTNNPLEAFNWYLKESCSENVKQKLPLFIVSTIRLLTDNRMRSELKTWLEVIYPLTYLGQ
jgi:hypothetical protein